MRLLLLLSISLLLAWPAAHAQSADDYFNGGAQAYISNDIPQALTSVETGLKQYPDDVKLKKLYELLKQQSQQQSQNNQSQQNQQPQSQSNQSQQQKSNGQQNQPSSPQNSQAQKPDQQKSSGQENAEAQKQQPPQKSDEKQNGEKPENPNEQGQPARAGQMTPEDARRLLDAQKGDEQFLQLKPQGKPQNQQQPIKDW